MSSSPAFSDVLRLPPGPVNLRSIETDAAPGYDGDKKSGKADLWATGEELFDLQQRLFAGKDDGQRSVLLVLQGMDTSGKGGTLKHTVGLVDPQGVKITSFKAPSKEDLAHDFLWRIRRAVPARGSSDHRASRRTLSIDDAYRAPSGPSARPRRHSGSSRR